MQITSTQKEFAKIETKKLGEYHDLYVQSDTLLVADIFENFRNMCDPGKCLSAPGLTWQAPL